MVTGLSTDYKRDCKVDIDGYVEESTDAVVTNDNTERARKCVDIGPRLEIGKAQSIFLTLRRARYFILVPCRSYLGPAAIF